MTFLSSRVIGRGSVPPPAVVALITDAFLLIFRYRLAAGDAWVAGWQDAPAIAAVAADARERAGAMPLGKRKRDARELAVSQQKFKNNYNFFENFCTITEISLKIMKI